MRGEDREYGERAAVGSGEDGTPGGKQDVREKRLPRELMCW